MAARSDVPMSDRDGRAYGAIEQAPIVYHQPQSTNRGRVVALTVCLMLISAGAATAITYVVMNNHKSSSNDADDSNSDKPGGGASGGSSHDVSTCPSRLASGGLLNQDVYRIHSNSYNGLDNRNGADVGGDIGFGFTTGYAAYLFAEQICNDTGTLAEIICDKVVDELENPVAPTGTNVYTLYKTEINNAFGLYQMCNYNHTTQQNECHNLESMVRSCRDPLAVGLVTFKDHFTHVMGQQALLAKYKSIPPPAGPLIYDAVIKILPELSPVYELFHEALWYSFPEDGHCAQDTNVTACVPWGVTSPEHGTQGCSWKIHEAVKSVNASCVESHLEDYVTGHAQSCISKCASTKDKKKNTLCKKKCYFTASFDMTMQELSNVWLKAFHNDCGAVAECIGPECLPHNPQGHWPPK